MVKGNGNEKLLKEVVAKLEDEGKGKGFRIKNHGHGDDIAAESEVTKLGNYLRLRVLRNILVPEICNTRPKEGILSDIDALVKKIIFLKFGLFTTGVYINSANLAAAEIAETITNAFKSYERILRNIVSEQELIALANLVRGRVKQS